MKTPNNAACSTGVMPAASADAGRFELAIHSDARLTRTASAEGGAPDGNGRRRRATGGILCFRNPAGEAFDDPGLGGTMLTNTTEIGTATLPRRRLTIPAPTDVSPSAPRRPPRFPALAQFASAARRVPRAPIPVAVALAVLAVLATVAPEPAAAQTVTTFISNTGQRFNTAAGEVQAVAFTTGTGTYTLSSVGIVVDIQSGSPTPAVKIYGDSGGNPGTTLLATMTNPGTFETAAVNSFTAPANTTLSASTTYWVVTSNSAATDGQGFRVGLTILKTLDTGTAVGWSLGNARSKDDIAATSWTASNRSLRFEIRGTGGTTTNNPPTVATAIPDQPATVGTAFSYAFPANTFSDADTGDMLTYAATQADGATLPTWLSFAAGTRTFSGTPQTADVGTVSVEVTASDSNDESVSGEFDITVSAAANNLATGALTITGTATVGQTLTAVTTGIMDADGLNNVSYAYQWIQVDGGAETNISGATASTYTLVTADLGTTIKVKVSFTDDASNPETLTSTATVDVTPAPNTIATGAPTITGTATVGQTLTAGTTAIMDADGLTTPTYTYQWIRVATDNTETNITSATASTYTLVTADQGKTIKVKVSFTDDASNAETLTSAATAAVSAAANTPATGAPTITGMAQVGQTLTAGTTGIMDADGLTSVSYTYQWIRVATNNTEAPISGATASTYMLVAADLGTTIKVRVSFTDDASNTETLTSAATAAVSAAANTPATGAPTITGRPQVGQTLPAGTRAIMDADGLTSVSYTYQWIRVDGGTETNISGATARTYTLVAADQGTMIKVRVSFTDDASNAETLTSAATALVLAAANTPATGAPTIAGTAQVGQTLTAVTTAIMDANGLTSVSYTYQWIRVATDNTETNITGATASTYTLVAADQGTTIKVKVSFTDDASKAETLTSAATAAVTVSAPPDTTPPTLTSATVWGGEHIELQFSENIPLLNQPPGSAFTVTADGVAVTTPSSPTWALPSTPDLLWLQVSPVIFQDQAVVVTYTDPTAGDDANAIQDTAGNDAADFTTGMDGVPAVTNNSAVTNTPATGAPTITGTAQVGQTLTAGTTAIMDADGLTSVSYTYQWIRTAAGVETNISGATASTYTLVAADQGTTVKVRVSFTDDASKAETLTSAATAVVAAAPNTPATGAPTITGTAQVGQTLTAGTTAIMDADGLTTPSYTYQWIRVATDNSETNISGATASTHTLVAADQGTTVKVKVSFTDDANNPETLTSAATAAVSAAPNTPATGAPTITGTAQVGQTLTADTTAIMDADGLTNVSYTYQWIRVDGGTETNISGATASTYTLVAADQGTTIKVTVSFTDDASNAETLTSAATAAVSAAPNTPATGAPTITGTAQVGQTLTAGTTAIMDADGLTSVSYTYQWIRVATDNTETNISSAAASTYTLVAADQGTTVKVTVSFTDDANNPETLTSAATAAVTAAANTPATGAPTITGTAQVGQTLTAGTTAIMDADGLTAVQAIGLYKFQWIRVATDNSETNIASATVTYTLVAADQGTTVKVTVSFTDDASNAETLTSAATAAVAAAPNTPATGAPTITGTAQVGQTLTADTTAIMDADGLTNVSYTYQWIRVATDNTETNIASATASTYTLVAADQGTTIKVTVSFTDDASNAETLTSAATATVSAAANTPATGAPTITGTATVGQTLTAGTTAIMDADGLTSVSYTYQWIRVATDNTETNISGATASTYTLVAADQGKTIKVTVSFTDDASNDETLTSAATAAVSAAPNTPATGAPTITGTAQVGQTLTADTTAIVDADGLTSVSYTYQWIRVDGGTETNIASATASTYTLVAADQGTTIKVTVSFTDDASNAETLTSAATATVTASTNTPATGAPTITGTAQVGQTLTAGTTAIVDADGLTSVSYTYQWIRVATDNTETNISGATASTHTLVAADLGTTIKVTVSFTDDASNAETRTSAATAAVSATPLGMPSVPESLTATGGDGEVVLEWTEPADDGGSPVTGYEYRYAAGQAVPEDVTWRDAGTELTATVSGLENETRYAFEVRARTGVGPGQASRATALPLRLRAELFSSAAAEGEALVVGVRRSGGLAFPAHAYIGVTDDALPGVRGTEEGRGDGLGRHRLEFAAGAAEATVTVTVAFDGERRQDRVLGATLDSAELEVDGVRRPYELVTPTLVVPVTEGDAGLSVADARVQGKSSVLAFTVSLDRTRDVAVRVDYATEDGSARAGEDYTPVSGTLTIEAGGRERTVEVAVLPALHVTGERTLTLRLSNAVSAVIDDGVATGVIVRESELPKAWLARFGRTASDHAAQAIARRLEAGQRETQVTVAGRRVDGLSVDGLLSGALPSGGWRPASAVEDMATRLAAPALAASGAPFGGVDADPGTPGLRAGTWGGAPGALDREPFADAGQTLRRAVLPDFGFRLPGAEEALMGTSFYVERGAQQDVGGGTWAAWGDVAATRFEGDAGGHAIDGDVVTGTAGLDRRWRALLVGLALSRSSGEGGYGTGAATIASTLTSVHPYMQVRLGERAQVWGAAGWGRGGLEITPGSGAMLEADLRNSMAAAGARAVLMGAGGLEIALRSDLLWTETASDGTAALAEAVGTASRGRLMLEGAGQIQGLGGVVRPKVEGGVRYDGGDAETGRGFEVGGGLDWARGSLTLQLSGRMLVAHADESYEEWGYSGSLVYEPGADGLGLQMRVGSSTGAAASGIQNLWALENASGLVRGGAVPFAQRFDAEVGYGIGRGTLWYPYFVADDSGQTRYGLKLSSGRTMGVGLEFGRRESVDLGPQDAMLLRGELRF